MASQVKRSARAVALESAADHLELDWTDDPIELLEGRKVSSMLRGLADEERSGGREDLLDRMISEFPAP